MGRSLVNVHYTSIPEGSSGVFLIRLPATALALLGYNRTHLVVGRYDSFGTLPGFTACFRAHYSNRWIPAPPDAGRTPTSRQPLPVTSSLGCCPYPFLSHIGALSQTEDVHISPRVGPEEKGSTASLDSSLNMHSAPFKVDVDLVLVPVTITDPMNRLVTGPGNENISPFTRTRNSRTSGTFPAKMRPFPWGDFRHERQHEQQDRACPRGRDRVLQNRQPAGRILHDHLRGQAGGDRQISRNRLKTSRASWSTPFPRAAPPCWTRFTWASARCGTPSIPKKALLIISDGGDNHSRYTEGEIKSVVKEADLFIYAIGIYDHYCPPRRSSWARRC